MSQSQYIKMHSEKVVFVTTLRLSQKPLIPRQIEESLIVSEKSYDLIFHIALGSKQMLKVYILKTHSNTFSER